MRYDVVFESGSAESLIAAAYCGLAGRRVLVAERGPRVGQELATESFLSPFGFDLQLGFLLRAPAAHDVMDDLGLFDLGLHLTSPDVPLAVVFAERPPFRLHRRWADTLQAAPRDAGAIQRLVGDGELAERVLFGDADPERSALPERLVAENAREALDHYGVEDGDLRCALTYLLLAFGLAPDVPGAGLTLALLAAGLERFTVVSGGTGALGAALIDRIVLEGGSVLEREIASAAADAGEADVLVAAGPATVPAGRGIGRLYLGVAGGAPVPAGHITVVGFESEGDIDAHLAAVGAGRLPAAPAGHFTVRVGDGGPGAELRSIVWEGVLPVDGCRDDDGTLRAHVTGRVVRALGSPQPLFRMLWFPHETHAPLAQVDWRVVAAPRADPGAWLAAGPRTVLAAITGLAIGRRRFATLT